MGRRCGVCAHQQADAINDMLASGRTLREITGRFPDVSKSALHRHRAHIGLLLAAAKQAAGADMFADVLAKLDGIEKNAVRLAKKAEEKGDIRTAGHLATTEARALVELVARLRGLLASGGQVNVGVAIGAPEFEKAVQAASDARIRAWAAALPEPLRGQVVAHAQQANRARLEAETERLRALADAKEPAPIYRLAAPSPDGEGDAALLPGADGTVSKPGDQGTLAIPLLQGGPGTGVRPDGGAARAQVRALARRFGYPHVVLPSGCIILPEPDAWQEFETTASRDDVDAALQALTIAARGLREGSGPQST